MQIIERRDRLNQHNHVVMFIDELKYYLTRPVLDALSTVRDHGCNLLLGHQAPGDLLDVSKDLSGQACQNAVITNTNIKLIYKLNEERDQRWAATLTGEKTVMRQSMRQRTNMGVGEITNTDERQLMGVQESLYSHNYFAQLRPRVGIVIGLGLAKLCFTSPIKVKKTPLVFPSFRKEKDYIQALFEGSDVSKLTKKPVIYDFRQNDLKNGGQGAPLTPIYHKLLAKSFKEEGKIKLPIIILNIGGIANITSINENYEISSKDIGPGNCLIDKWIRINSDQNFDMNGDIARSGKIDKFILEQTIDNFYYNQFNKKKSLDINDFDISFAKGLSLEDGAATITELTADILSKKLVEKDIYVCGGGRKNQFLINSIKNKINNKIFQIDNLGIDGGFIESQAFGYLAIRSYLKLPISFPETTGCKEPCSGGVFIKNF